MKDLLDQLAFEMRNDMILSLSQDENHFYFRLQDSKQKKVVTRVIEKKLHSSRDSRFYKEIITDLILNLNRLTN